MNVAGSGEKSVTVIWSGDPGDVILMRGLMLGVGLVDTVSRSKSPPSVSVVVKNDTVSLLYRDCCGTMLFIDFDREFTPVWAMGRVSGESAIPILRALLKNATLPNKGVSSALRTILLECGKNNCNVEFVAESEFTTLRTDKVSLRLKTDLLDKGTISGLIKFSGKVKKNLNLVLNGDYMIDSDTGEKFRVDYAFRGGLNHD